MGGTCGSGIVSCQANVIGMREVRGMCTCLARGGVGVEEGIGLYQSCGNRGSVGRVSVLRWCRWGWDRRVRWCYVCVTCESGFLVHMAGPCICILCQADTCTS